MQVSNLRTIAQVANTSPFSESQLRWYTFNEQTNGFAEFGVVRRVGRRVFLDVTALEKWIESGRAGQKSAA